MKLSPKSLKKTIKGALAFKETGTRLTPYRYTQAQLDYMADESYDWGWRMRAKFTGCVRIAITTDATKISFGYEASHSHERANTIDLYVDGILTSVYKIGENLKGRVEFSMKEGKKRVDIYLPCESELAIKDFEINGTYSSRKPKKNKLLIMGDSITQGAGPDITSAAYANQLERLLGNYEVVAQGIGGYRCEPCDLMLTEGFVPDKVLTFLGTNYYDVLSYDYENETRKYYKRVRELYPNTPIYAVTPLWRNNGVDWDRFNWCIDVAKKAIAEVGDITLIDGFELVPNVDECFSDGVHPNAYGSVFLAEGIKKVIERLK